MFREPRVTGEDQKDEQPNVPDLPGTKENIKAVLGTVLTFGLSPMTAFTSGINNPNQVGLSPFGLTSTLANAGRDFATHAGLGRNLPGAVDYFDVQPDFSFGVSPSPGEFASNEPGVAYSSLGYGETDFGTGYTSRDVADLEADPQGYSLGDDAALSMANEEAAAGSRGRSISDSNEAYGEGPGGESGEREAGCVISTALNDTGAWSPREKARAVRWCQNTHHTGSLRGRLWVDGYHQWGRIIARMARRSVIFRRLVKVCSTAFVGQVTGDDPSVLGFVIRWGWATPLSYTVGGYRWCRRLFSR